MRTRRSGADVARARPDAPARPAGDRARMRARRRRSMPDRPARSPGTPAGRRHRTIDAACPSDDATPPTDRWPFSRRRTAGPPLPWPAARAARRHPPGRGTHRRSLHARSDGLDHLDRRRRLVRDDHVAAGLEEVDGARAGRDRGDGRGPERIRDHHAVEPEVAAEHPVDDRRREDRKVVGIDPGVGRQRDHHERHARVDRRGERLEDTGRHEP